MLQIGFGTITDGFLTILDIQNKFYDNCFFWTTL
jgi:hypothetical protein